jgi:glycosyltransferase involved in cell wall biosynthesis
MRGRALVPPLVSVCIPTYNSAETITRCLESVVAQRGVDFELLVVDDDSSDDTVSTVRAFLRPGDRLIVNETRLGLVGNHNRCLELARGKYIQFVHADDELLADALFKLTRELDSSNAGFAFAPRRVVTDDEDFLRRYGCLHKSFRGLAATNDGRRLTTQIALRGVHENWIGEPTSVMFSRTLALEAGLFRDDIYQALDLDLWLRLMVRSRVCFHSEALSIRNHTSATETERNKSSGRAWLDQLRVLSTLAVDPEAPRSLRAINSLWWVAIWLRVVVESVAFGPSRSTRLKLALKAPICEFSRAREVFDCAEHASTSETTAT